MPIPTRDQLMRFLRIGRINAITSKEIADHFGISNGYVEVPLRDIIRDAIENGELIGSTNRGFFIIDNEEEFNNYIASLESRRVKIASRITNLRNNWNNRNR